MSSWRQGTSVTCPEFGLILACARSAARGEPDVGIAALLTKSLDWENLLQLSKAHGLLSIVAEQLRSFDSQIPPHFVRCLRKAALVNAGRNLLLSAELHRTALALTQAGIQFVPYKGVVLEEQLYGSFGLREVNDIDLIVNEDDRRKTIACLEALGYESAYPLPLHLQEAAMRYTKEWPYLRDGLTVDLHWRIIQKPSWPSLDMAAIWRELQSMSWQSMDVRTLAPPVLLAALGVHASEHGWSQLRLFTDIAAVIHRFPNLDWEQVEELVADSQSRRSLFVSLWLSRLYFEAALPDRILREIRADSQVARIAECVVRSWTRPTALPYGGLRWLLFRTAGERSLDRLRFILSLMFLPAVVDYQSLRLPPGLVWGYFVWRPVRLLFKLLRTPTSTAPASR